MSEHMRPVFILGMHRSGTSCLAGCLEDAGLFLGDVNEAAPFNLKGNRENKDAMELNDRVLAQAGASWDLPPDEEPNWSSQHYVDLDRLIASYPNNQVWGLKDPRVLLTLKGWRQKLSPRFAGTFRHPCQVAKSLTKRAEAWNADMTQTQAFNLWLTYNKRMLQLYHTQTFTILRYDIDADAYLEKVSKLACELELPQPSNISFYDDNLHHHSYDDDIPNICLPIWEELNDIAL